METNNIPFKDRRDLFVLRTYIYDAEDYFYWQTNSSTYVRGLNSEREKNRAYIFSDRALADTICSLLNRADRKYGFEVVSVYSAWRCINDDPEPVPSDVPSNGVKVFDQSSLPLPLPDTPRAAYHQKLKRRHPDAVILYRCGDFYESYYSDAQVLADTLGITLTSCRKSPDDMTDNRVAGFPYHALDTYLPKLIRAGKRVVICDEYQPTNN